MIRTIRIGNHQFVQGLEVGRAPCGHVSVLVDGRRFIGLLLG